MKVAAAAPALATLTIGLPAGGLIWAIADTVRHGLHTPDLVLLAVMYLLVAFGTETGFHRLISHRSFRATPAVTAVLTVLGSMAAQGPPLFWAAVHRQHHAHTDRPGDPHSPHLPGQRGFLHAHVGWLFASRSGEDLRANVNDLLRDRVVITVNRLYHWWVLLGLLIPGLLGLWWTGTLAGAARGVLFGGLARIALWQQVTWSVNSMGHLVGERPFATGDRSANNVWLVPLTLGGAWHNNHHAFPSSAKVGLLRGQVDVHFALIWILHKLGLVSAVKLPAPGRIEQALGQRGEIRHDVAHQ